MDGLIVGIFGTDGYAWGFPASPGAGRYNSIMQILADDAELYEAVGSSEQPFFELVDAFYARVEADPPLRSVYPPDLTEGKQHLAWFLIQRFGGPEHFNRRRGAPMLRRRHFPFTIDRDQAMRWVRAMSGAIDATAPFTPYKPMLMKYFEDSALFLVNHNGEEDVDMLEGQLLSVRTHEQK